MGSTGVMKVESRKSFDERYSKDGVSEFTIEVTSSQASQIGSN